MTPACISGRLRYYFPEYPNHPYNGCFAHAASAFVLSGDEPLLINGKPCRKRITTFESGHFGKEELHIRASDFGDPVVLVKHWSADDGTEQFYLID